MDKKEADYIFEEINEIINNEDFPNYDLLKVIKSH